MLNVHVTVQYSTCSANPSAQSRIEITQHFAGLINYDAQMLMMNNNAVVFSCDRFCYVDEQWDRFPKQQYDTCRPLASEKWGTYKCGEYWGINII